ncbi:MAG: HEAT repeat domain-containing protein [Verrucomicrobia bacterium]|nr:HEAT repeat domain-containing protein [Verrucomicrobiota bacterium]MCH8526333.1 HEAT repeat domain-containing protein [Kiritimatiellia bacterium]
MTRIYILLLCCALLPSGAAPPRFDPGGDAASPGPGMLRELDRLSLPDPGPDHLRWLENMDVAQMSAKSQGQMMMVLFSSPGCSWCRRLKQEVLADPDLRPALRRFTLVEIDVDRNPSQAMRRGVRNVPTVVWMDSDGRELFRIAGFLPSEDFSAVLDQILSPGQIPGATRHAGLLRRLAEAPPTPDLLIEALTLLPAADPGGNVREALRTMSPPPVAMWVDLLEHPRLVVRLGALELLEELAGTSRGFDPWSPPASEAAREARTAWRAWVEDAPDVEQARPRFARLTREQVEDAVRELGSDVPEREQRAMRTLALAGPAVQPYLQELLEQEAVTEPLRSRLKDVILTLDLQRIGWPDPGAAAHRLRRAPLDTRLHLLRAVRERGREAVPVLSAFLNDSDILIREAVVEGLLLRGGPEALPQVLTHLETEESIDVAVTAMRNLKSATAPDGESPDVFGIASSTQTPEEAAAVSDWLRTQLDSGNEERILAALNAVREGRYPSLIPRVTELLEDERWRVRAEAARTLGGTRSRDRLPDLMKHARDPDPFARNMILETALGLAENTEQRGRMIETWWAEFPEDRLSLLRIACGSRVTLPEAFFETLADREHEELVTVLGILDGCASSRVRAGLKLAEHSDADVSAAALRLLARHGLSASGRERREAEAQLVRALRQGPDAFRLAVADAIRLPRSTSGPDPISSLLRGLTGAQATADGAGDPLLDDLLGAFAEPSAPAPAPEPDAAGLDDLLAAFEEPAAPATVDGGASLEETLLDLFQTTEDEALRLVSARVLVEMGNAAALPHLIEHAATLPEEDLTRLLNRPGNDDMMLRAARDLLDDPRSSVRTAATLELAGRDFAGTFLPLFFEDPPAISPESVPWNRHQLQEQLRESALREVRPYIEKGLSIDTPDTPPAFARLSLALALAAYHRNEAFTVGVQPHTRNLVDPHLRAQAWVARLNQSAPLTADELDRLTRDPATPVRRVLPWWFLRTESKRMSWQILPEMAVSLSRRAAPARVSPDAEQRLNHLLTDAMPEVRVLAGAALISQARAPEAADWLEALPQLPDASAIAEAIWDPVQSQLLRLGPEYRPFVDWLASRDVWRVRERTAPWYSRHSRATPETADSEPGDEIRTAFLRADTDPDSADENPDGMRPEEGATTLTLLYFYSEGCPDCIVVREMLNTYESTFPDLTVREIDITEPGALDLYYEIYLAYGLPLSQVGLTPMVAGAGGADCGAEALEFDRIGDIIARSLDSPGTGWIPVPRPAAPETDAADWAEPEEEPGELPEVTRREARPEAAPASATPRVRIRPTPQLGLLLLLSLPVLALFSPIPPAKALPAALAALFIGALLPVSLPANVMLAVVVMLVLSQGGNLAVQLRRSNRNSLSGPLLTKQTPPWIPTLVVAGILFLIGLSAPLSVWPGAAAQLPPALWGAAFCFSLLITYARWKKPA